MRTPSHRPAPQFQPGRSAVPQPSLTREPTFFIGTEADIESSFQNRPTRQNSYGQPQPRHNPHANKNITSEPSSSLRTGRTRSNHRPNTEPVIFDNDSETYEDDTHTYGVESMASELIAEIDTPTTHRDNMTGTLTQPQDQVTSAPPVSAPPVSPALSRFGGLTSASSLLGSSSSLAGESVFGALSDYPISYNEEEFNVIPQNDLQMGSPPSLSSLRPTLPEMPSDESQLIMPTVSVPTRRPFTATGRCLGRLKLAVVGSRASGKSSFINAILHNCEHVVHVDTPRSNGAIAETTASTKPHPRWRSQSNSSVGNSKEKAGTLELLDRNISLLEIPMVSNTHDSVTQVLEVIQGELAKTMSGTVKPTEDPEPLIRLLGSEESPLISAVVYLISPSGLTDLDVCLLEGLQKTHNVIVVLPQVDLQLTSIMQSDKAVAVKTLETRGIRPFDFGMDNKTLSRSIYAVSTAREAEPCEMEMSASLLMESSYHEKLVESDLGQLVSDIFSLEGSSWLRHSAAELAVDWWKKHQIDYSERAVQLRQPRPLHFESFPMAGSIIFRGGHRGSISAEYWARSLQRSLANARIPLYQQLAIDIDREMTLVHQSEAGALICRQAPGELVRHRTANEAADKQAARKHRRRADAPTPQQDPLGLLTTIRGFKNTGWSAVQVMSALGLVGSGLSLGNMR